MVFVITDVKFFRVPIVMYVSLSGACGLADRGFVLKLSKASYTSEGAEVLTTGALSFRVHARVAALTTIVTALSP